MSLLVRSGQWSDLKRKLKAEGAVEVYENIVQLKMTAPDGKKRLTGVADTGIHAFGKGRSEYGSGRLKSDQSIFFAKYTSSL